MELFYGQSFLPSKSAKLIYNINNIIILLFGKVTLSPYLISPVKTYTYSFYGINF